MAPFARKSIESVHCKLYVVFYHHGESASVGLLYYMVDVLHPNGDSDGEETWPHTDIEAVRAVRHEDVFWDHEAERVDERCANMLFYRRTSPTETR